MSKRKSYSVKEKLAVIARIKNGESKSSIKKQCGIPEGTLRGWLDDEAKLLSFVNRVEDEVGLCRKRTRLGKHTTLDECLYIWYLQKRNEGALLSTSALKQQAEKLQVELHGNKEFKASDGWLWRWQKRHGVTRDSMLGAARPIEYEGAGVFLSQVEREISEGGYCEEQVYCCGQATLCFKMLPSKRLDLPSDGQKQSSERITLLLCVNQTGNHKLKPLCIGKSRQPRCFKNINTNSLPMIYASSSNIAITHNMFEAWFQQQFVMPVRLHLLSRNMDPKALLLFDDHHEGQPSGAEIFRSSDGKIRAVFLPKNSTNLLSHLPLEQGIIRVFKKNYRRELLLALMSSNEDATTFLKSVTLKDVAYKIGLAWGSIPAGTIIHCWGKCLGEKKGNVDLRVSSEQDWIKIEDETPDEYIDEDSGDFEGFSSPCAQDWIIHDEDKVLVSNAKQNDSESDDGGDSGEPAEVPKINEALECLDVVMNWLEAQDDVDSDKLLHIASIKEYMLRKKFVS
ncbi:tigger transposable element derived 5-like [Periplaneta americana]|uniref:tigger transposable element derived 5-like n=1 Tax=Periplaneta americana TaxID=6978 RepID=UPI0037E77DD1